MHTRFSTATIGLGLVLALVAGCGATLGEVDPMPNVATVSMGNYSLDSEKVPDVLELERGLVIQDVRRSVENGFRNAVGEEQMGDGPSVQLVFDTFSARIDSGQVGILRITYKARWLDAGGDLIARAVGTALPLNPIQTGEGHWRDVIEVMYVQVVDSLARATARGKAPVL